MGKRTVFREQNCSLMEREQKCEAFLEQNCSLMRKRTEVRSVFGTKLFCYRKENRSAKSFSEQNCSLMRKRKEVRSVLGTKLFSYGKEKRSAKRFSKQNCFVMRKRTEVWIVFGTKLFCYRKENRSAKRFRNEIVVLWERALEWKSFSEPNCSVMRNRTDEEIVLGTKLLCYRKENRSATRFRNQIVLLWETEQKRKSFSEQNCPVIGKKTEVRSVFGTKLFSYEKEKRSAKRFGNKIVLLWEREEKCEAISKQNCFVMRKRTEVWIVFGKNCSVIGKKREVRIVFETKLLSYGKEHWSGNHFRNQIVLLWEREQKRKSFSKENCSFIDKKTEVRSVFGTKLFSYGKEKSSAKRFRNKIVLLWEREQKCESFSEQNCSVIGKKTEVRIVFGTKLLSYGKQHWSGNHFRNQIVLLWERGQKRKSVWEQNCSVIGKKTEVRRVFGTKLFSYEIEKRSAKRFGNKIVLLWEREEKCEAISKQNGFVMRKRTEVWIVFGKKLFCYRKENRSAKRFRNGIVVLWERALEWKSFSEPNCSVMRNRTEEEIVLGTKLFCYRKENRSAKRFRNQIVLLLEREEKCEAFWEQNCSLMGKWREVRSVFATKLFCYEKENRSVNRFRNKIVLL